MYTCIHCEIGGYMIYSNLGCGFRFLGLTDFLNLKYVLMTSDLMSPRISSKTYVQRYKYA